MSDAVERQIRAAIERGEFDHLPGAGEPLEELDRPYDPNWWLRAWIERDRRASDRGEDLTAIERQARRLWAAPTASRLEAIMDEIDETRTAAGLDPLDRSEARRMWQSVRRHRDAGGREA